MKQTPTYIRRHRGRMMPGGVGYSDAPTFGGFGSKLPFSEYALGLADLEAAFLGNAAKYCIHMGSIPRISLRPFWFVNGDCLGLRTLGHDEDEFDLNGNHTGRDYLAPLYPIVDHLAHYAPFIVGTEGIDTLLDYGEAVREVSKDKFPQESEDHTDWVGLEEARRITGRSERTLRDWVRSGYVKSLGEGVGRDFFREDLLLMVKVMEENQRRSPGRPRKEV